MEILDFLVEAYPNPFNNSFNVHVISSEETPVKVTIHDLTGRVVSVYENVMEQTELGNDLLAGIYFAQITQGDNYQILQIVKEK